MAAARRVMPLPTARERRLALRLRAAEIVSLLEGTAVEHPEAEGARDAFAARLADVARSAALRADEARAAGLDPLTFHELALDSGTGASLLQIAPLPPRFSYSSLDSYERCPLQYAFTYVYRMPEPARPRAPLAFGSTAHETFEQFTRERRERIARGEPGPTREDLERLFRERWVPTAFGDKETEAAYGRRIGDAARHLLAGRALHRVRGPRRGVQVHARARSRRRHAAGPDLRRDRPHRPAALGRHRGDRLQDRQPVSQKDVHQNLQLTIYALACRDALGLGTPEQVTLYYTELGARMSTTRTDAQLDVARAELLARVRPIRSGDFAATPGGACRRCDYGAMCPERA